MFCWVVILIREEAAAAQCSRELQDNWNQGQSTPLDTLVVMMATCSVMLGRPQGSYKWLFPFANKDMRV